MKTSLIFLFVLYFIVSESIVHANPKVDNLLTSEEIKWIKNNPVIKVGGQIDWAPFDFVKDGEYQGISKDILDLIAEKSGLKFNYVTGLTWKELIDEFKSHRLDIMPAIYHTQEREIYTVFTPPYLKIKDYVFTQSNNDSIKHIDDIQNKKVAVIDGYAIIENLKQRYPDIDLVKVSSLSEGIDAVLINKADVYIDAYPVMMYTLSNMMQTGIKPVLPVNFYSNDLHIGISKTKPLLASIINKTLKQISQQEKNTIFNKWTAIAKQKKPSIEITAKEKAWLKKHPVIKVGNDKEWPPFDFYENNTAKGYSMDYLRALAEIIGINLEFVQDISWDALISQFENKQLDILTAYENTPNHQPYALFTEPFLKTVDSIIIRADKDFIKDYKQLYGKKVAVIKGYEIVQEIKKYPEIEIVLVDTPIEGLKKVNNADVDALIENGAVANYLIKKHQYTNLKLAGTPDFPGRMEGDEINIAVQKSLPELYSLLVKATKVISDKTIQELEKKWLNPTNTQERTRIKLSAKEKQWLKDNPTVNVANEMDWPPFDYNKDGKALGLSIDYIKLIAERTGIQVKYINNHTWPELIKLYNQQKIDVMPAFYKNAEREKTTLFTSPYYKGTLGIFIRNDNETINNITNLKNKVIGIQKGDGSIPIIQKVLPKFKLKEIETTDALLKQLATGQFDAIIGNPLIFDYYKKEHQISNVKLLNFVPISEQDQEMLSLYIGISNNKPLLYQIIQKGLASISVEDRNKIKNKWLNTSNSSIRRLNLTTQEQAWLNKKIPIRYVYDPNWPPFEWTNEFKKHTGMVYDFINLIAKKSGIIFEPVHVDSWDKAVSLARERKVDMYSAINQTEKKQQYMHFSQQSIYETPYVFLVKKEDANDYVDTFKAVANKKVGVVSGYSIHDQLSKEYPDISLILASSPLQAFEMLQESKIDIFIVNAATARYFINKKGFHNFRIATKTDLTLKPKIAIRNDWPKEVISIIDKTMATITDQEKSDIQVKWTEATIIEQIDYALLWKIAIAILILFSIFAFYNRKLKTALNSQIESEEKTRLLLTSIGEGIFGVGKDGLVNFINPAALAMLQYDEGEIIGKRIHPIIHHTRQDGSKYPVEECPMYHAQTEGKYSQIENEVLWRKDGTSFPVEYMARPVIKDEKVSGSVVTFTDITEKLLARRALEEAHKHTRDSIKYASLIQSALIPDNKIFQKHFQDYFTIWHPKDIVGGDIYLAEEISEHEVLIMVIDCTGHGVPGAFVTMLVKAVERQITSNLYKDGGISPALILNIFNRNIKHLLKQESIDSISNAGFDGGILYYNKKEQLIKFSGAETSLFYLENKELRIIKGSRHSVGYKKSDPNYQFKEHTIDVNQATQIYITTDGYLDQNGGEKSFPFGKKRFKQLLLDNYNESMADQKELLMYELQNYQKNNERNDDITVVGLKF